MGLNRLDTTYKGPIDLTNKLKASMLDQIHNKINENMEGLDYSDLQIIEDEAKVIEEFLNKFIIMPESGVNDQIDIKLMVKALPNKIMPYSIETIDLFNLRIF